MPHPPRRCQRLEYCSQSPLQGVKNELLARTLCILYPAETTTVSVNVPDTVAGCTLFPGAEAGVSFDLPVAAESINVVNFTCE